MNKIDKIYVVTCPSCKGKIEKSYKSYWAYKSRSVTKKCFKCSRMNKGMTNSGSFKKGEHKSPKTEFKNILDEELKYGGVHNRIRNKLGNPRYCEICKKSNLSLRQYHWSNKNHKYSLRVEDWQRVCASCHKKYDNKLKNNIK